MARVRERKIRDFNQVKCIKDEREHLLVKEDEIRHRWQEYFDKFFDRTRCLTSGGEVYWYQSTRIKGIFKVVLITGELS